MAAGTAGGGKRRKSKSRDGVVFAGAALARRDQSQGACRGKTALPKATPFYLLRKSLLAQRERQ